MAQGVWFVGTAPRSLPLGDGVRCVGGMARRLGAAAAGGNGVSTWSVDLGAAPLAALIGPGRTLYYQYWYRDSSPAGSNTSDGLSVMYWP